MASAMTIVAQLSQGDTCENASGTGIDQMKPITVMTIGGTQMMCSSSLRGLLWLSPYSPNHCSTVRMPVKLRRRRDLCKNARPNKEDQEAGMPLMQRFMKLVARSGILSDARLLELYPPFVPMRIK